MEGFMKTFFLALLMALSLKALAESIETVPERGELKSEVKIEMYGDYQCPYTQRGNASMDKMLGDIRNDFSLSFRHHPLDYHEQARYAHKSAICAKEQGRFWEMHDELFKLSGAAFTTLNIDKITRNLGLSNKQFATCMNSKEAENIIARDLKEANRLKIDSTPTFIITGPKGSKVLKGAYPIEDIKKAIREVLD